MIGWLFPTQAATAQAAEISRKGHLAEWERPEEYEGAHIGTAIVHGRQDIAGIFVMQAAIHSQLVKISRGVWWLGFALLAAASALLDKLG